MSGNGTKGVFASMLPSPNLSNSVFYLTFDLLASSLRGSFHKMHDNKMSVCQEISEILLGKRQTEP